MIDIDPCSHPIDSPFSIIAGNVTLECSLASPSLKILSCERDASGLKLARRIIVRIVE